MLAGEAEAWKKLASLDPDEVAACAGAEYWYDDDVFVLPVFGKPYLVDYHERQIREIGPEYFFHFEEATHFGLLVPLYLSSCQERTEPSGKLVSPRAVPHGEAFFRGSHELPEEVLAHHFGSNPGRLIETAEKLGGTATSGGDAAVVIPVFPNLPVTVILWVGDLEFPARAQMLIDESAASFLPLDALWAALILAAEAITHVAGPHH
jgi:hypothetical protein